MKPLEPQHNLSILRRGWEAGFITQGAKRFHRGSKEWRTVRESLSVPSKEVSTIENRHVVAGGGGEGWIGSLGLADAS